MRASITLASFLGLAIAGPLTGRSPHETIQTNASWNLRDISHRTPAPRSATYGQSKFYYDSEAGKNTYAYILDTGVRITHKELEGRAENLWTAQKTDSGQDDFTDHLGHGTHVAGTVASRTFGVAKNARIFSVKFTSKNDGWSSVSNMMKGIAVAAEDIAIRDRKDKAVIQMSYGCAYSQAMNDLVNHVTLALGITMVVSAGNSAKDVSTTSPASAAGVIVVGSINRHWSASHFSNYGPGLSFFAPGEQVLSLTADSDYSIDAQQGTSMAAPHVSGVVLTAMSVFGQPSSAIKSWLDSTCTKGKMKDDGRGSPNRVINNNNARQSQE